MPNDPKRTPPDETEDLSALSDLAAEVIGNDGITITAEEDSRFRRPTTPNAERFPPLLDDYEPENDAIAPARSQAQPAPTPHKQAGGGCLYNLMTLVFLAGTVGLIVYFSTIWVDPYSPLNPLAPPTPFIEVSATPDTIAIATYETELTLAAIRPTAQAMVDMPPPTFEPEAPPTADVTAEPSNTPRPEFVFTLQEPGVVYRQNSNQRACSWESITGTIFDINGQPLNNYSIQIIDIEDARFSVSVRSGVFENLGPGVYEQFLSNTPRQKRYTIQLFDPVGSAVSEPFLIFTRDTCAENIAEVNFEQVR